MRFNAEIKGGLVRCPTVLVRGMLAVKETSSQHFSSLGVGISEKQWWGSEFHFKLRKNTDFYESVTCANWLNCYLLACVVASWSLLYVSVVRSVIVAILCWNTPGLIKSTFYNSNVYFVLNCLIFYFDKYPFSPRLWLSELSSAPYISVNRGSPVSNKNKI